MGPLYYQSRFVSDSYLVRKTQAYALTWQQASLEDKILLFYQHCVFVMTLLLARLTLNLFADNMVDVISWRSLFSFFLCALQQAATKPKGFSLYSLFIRRKSSR
jgi:hypothetical protein